MVKYEKAYVAEVEFENYAESVTKILNLIGANKLIAEEKKIILKPNLTTNKGPPVTTPIELVEEVLKYCRKNSKAEIIIAEGSGGCDTVKCFEELGFYKLEEKYGCKVIDLNREKRIVVTRSDALKLKRFKMPEILSGAFLINLPILKEHSSARVTAAMKNLFGLYLSPLAYRLVGWSKARLHRLGIHECIFDLNLYKKPNITLVDAYIGQIGDEIKGVPKKFGVLLAGTDPVAIDVRCAEILGKNWKEMEYLIYADGRLGTSEFELIK